jgi:hypothetical protein
MFFLNFHAKDAKVSIGQRLSQSFFFVVFVFFISLRSLREITLNQKSLNRFIITNLTLINNNRNEAL